MGFLPRSMFAPEGEFASGHVARWINVPGGQAVQRADDFVAVRNGQIVFISSAICASRDDGVLVPAKWVSFI